MSGYICLQPKHIHTLFYKFVNSTFDFKLKAKIASYMKGGLTALQVLKNLGFYCIP